MNYRLCRMGATAALVIWMAVIFLFSAQPAIESSEVSGMFSYRLVSVVNEMFYLDLSGEQIAFDAIHIEYPVRKAAHMTEYAIMGLLCFAVYASYGKRGRICYLLSAATAICYAATDEIHQLFVPGRSGRFTDVCVDASGVVIGLLFLSLLLKIIRKRCEKRIHPIQ